VALDAAERGRQSWWRAFQGEGKQFEEPPSCSRRPDSAEPKDGTRISPGRGALTSTESTSAPAFPVCVSAQTSGSGGTLSTHAALWRLLLSAT
jgi:hypothetical protein